MFIIDQNEYESNHPEIPYKPVEEINTSDMGALAYQPPFF
jgi:hypothetical protein